MTLATNFIDPPGRFAPLAEWESFLAEMRATRPQTEAIKQAIAEAEQMVTEKQGNRTEQ
jgi:hypothetical protein